MIAERYRERSQLLGHRVAAGAFVHLAAVEGVGVPLDIAMIATRLAVDEIGGLVE
ncbi:hypothetical protein [Neorhizobium galegae]|uniref:hypothetical protein n=1 Tax=Neorhizobium galegae TaxID=399 RepID=UPI003AEF6256